MSAPWPRKEFEDKLREKGKGYHIYHPFHVMMYKGPIIQRTVTKLGDE